MEDSSTFFGIEGTQKKANTGAPSSRTTKCNNRVAVILEGGSVFLLG